MRRALAFAGVLLSACATPGSVVLPPSTPVATAPAEPCEALSAESLQQMSEGRRFMVAGIAILEEADQRGEGETEDQLPKLLTKMRRFVKLLDQELVERCSTPSRSREMMLIGKEVMPELEEINPDLGRYLLVDPPDTATPPATKSQPRGSI